MLRIKRIVGPLLTLLIVAALGCSSTDDEKARGRPSSASEARIEADRTLVYRRVQVLCIGIDKYESSGISSLKWSVADALGVNEVFGRDYGYETKSLTGSAATKSAILGYLEKTKGTLGADDALIVFFAGHGQVVEDKAFGRSGFLVPVDAKVNFDDTRDIDEWRREAIDMADLGTILKDLPCRHVLLLIDCCHSGFLGARSGFASRKDYEELISRRSRMVLTAGTEDQRAYEGDDFHHGLFTHVLLKELNTTAAKSATELFIGLRNGVTNLSNGKMLPQLRELEVDNGEFVFLPKAIQDDALDAALSELTSRVTAQQSRRTEMSDVFAAFEAEDYRHGANAIEKQREWEARLKRFEDNASLGDPLAMAGLHYCYSKGLGVEKDVGQAYAWARRCLDGREPIGKHIVARCYLYGIGVQENRRVAEDLIREAADAGFPMSQFSRAMMLLEGTPSPEDQAKAVIDLDAAVLAGFPSAKWILGRTLVSSNSNSASDLERGKELIKSAADSGLASAEFEMYRLYVLTKETQPIFEHAAVEKALRAAADAGYVPAQVAMARECYRGLDAIGESRSFLELTEQVRQARTWAELAASQGNADAHLILAYMCLRGDGGQMDLEATQMHCDTAANAGEPGAWALQGLLQIDRERRVYPYDEMAALELAKKAVIAKNAQGMYLFGIINDRGLADTVARYPLTARPFFESVERDTEAMAKGNAALFYLAASEKGHADALAALERMELSALSLEHMNDVNPTVFRRFQEFRQQLALKRAAEIKRPSNEGEAAVARFRLSGPISAVGFLTDENLIYAAGRDIRDGSIRIFDIENGNEVKQIPGHDSGVRDVSFAPNMLYAASCPRRGNEVTIWDVDSGQVVQTFHGHQSSVTCITWSADNQLILSGDERGKVYLWNAGSGEETKHWDPFSMPIWKTSFYPDEPAYIALCATSGLQRINSNGVFEWQVFGPKSTRTDWKSGGTALTISADGRKAITSHTDSPITVWDLKTGKVINRLGTDGVKADAVAITADERFLVLAPNDASTLRVISMESGNTVKQFEGINGKIHCLAGAKNSNLIVSGNMDGSVSVWRIATE